MKTLYLLRHAKSSWDEPGLADFDRPLNDRGNKVAPRMGELLAERRLLPELVLSSPANRARSTAELVSNAAGLTSEIRFDERIYEASPQTLARVISDADERVNLVLIVGHNPGMEGLIMYLTGEAARMPTAALAIIEIDVRQWSDVNARTGRLIDVIRPNEVFA